MDGRQKKVMQSMWMERRRMGTCSVVVWERGKGVKEIKGTQERVREILAGELMEQGRGG